MVASAILAFGPFAVAGGAISHAAWPKLRTPLKVGTSVLLGAILLLTHMLLIAAKSPSRELAWLFIWAGVWFLIGLFAHYLLSEKVFISRTAGQTPGLSVVSRIRFRSWVGILAVVLFVVGFLLIPMAVDLGTDIVWRFRAYMAALGGVALVGAYTRKKGQTIVIGLGVMLVVTLLAWSLGAYPVGAPMLEANEMVREGFQSDLPVLGEIGVSNVIGMFSPFALVSDFLVAVVSIVLVGIAAVVLANAMHDRGTGRTVLALFVVLVLLVPGILIPYAYALGAGTIEFAATLGMGALKGYGLVKAVQDGRIDNDALAEVRAKLLEAGQHFRDSETLLTGLGRLKLFGFIRLLPVVGTYSETAKYLAWGLTNAARGLQTSALGIVDILEGVFTIFGRSTEAIGSFDVLGPALMETELNETMVSAGIMQIDSAFSQVLLGFPSIRLALRNISNVDPAVFHDRFPEVEEGLGQLIESTGDLEKGIDVVEVFLSDTSTPKPATHFLYAAYSLAKIAPNVTDLRDIRSFPSLDNVASNLSNVRDALEDPVVTTITEEGGDTGSSILFVLETVDLIDRMIDLESYAVELAVQAEEIRQRFQAKRVYEYTDIEIDEWIAQATSLTEHAEGLDGRIASAEDSIDTMLTKSENAEYGYANELAKEGTNLLEQILNFLRELKGLSSFSQGLQSLVHSMKSFNRFYDSFVRLERQVEAGNLVAATQTAVEARSDLREARLLAEDLMDRLEELPRQIQLPVQPEDVNAVVDTAATIELKLNYIESLLDQGDQERAMETIQQVEQDLADLAEELQLAEEVG